MVCMGFWVTQPARAAEPNDGQARKVLAQLVAHDFAAVRAHMTPQMTAAVTSDPMLAGLWQQFTGAVGDFQRVDSTQTKPMAGLTTTLLHCTFSHGPLDVLLVFDGQDRLAGLQFPPLAAWSPPAYAEPGRFDERDVTVGAAPFALAGKLTMPHGAGPFAAVVLVHGSGPNDENETIGPNQPFHDLALGLASRGIAVLRYQKRTRVYPKATYATVRDETTDDARAAVALLAKTPKIDRARIFVLGHSLGAMLAPRIAENNPLVAGLVIMAGPTRPLEDVVVEQMTARGTPEMVAAAKAARERIRDPKLAPDDIIDFIGVKISASYFLDLRHYSPADAAAKLAIPILVLQGDRDIQVRPVDFAGWRKALAARPHAKLVHYPKLTHLFTEGEGTVADYDKPGHVAPEVIEDIVDFVGKGGRR
jgi:hypothetical protein